MKPRNDQGCDHDRLFDPANFAVLAGGCFAVGAGLMYLFDPDRGGRRRNEIRDKALSAVNQTGAGLRKAARDARDRGRGVVAEAGTHFSGEGVSDDKLHARVRTALGRAVSQPRAVEVEAAGGVVTLRGTVPAGEADKLLRAVGRVRGVKRVESHLDVHPEAADYLPGVGGSAATGGRQDYDPARDAWSPSTRLLAGVAGAGFGLYGPFRHDWIGKALAVFGFGLAVRSFTNLSARQLTGVGAGRRAVDVRKTITINAPADQVFGFFSNYDMFPMFMANVRNVTDRGDGTSHWVVAGPAGVNLEWDSVLTDFAPHELIAWQSIGGAAVENEGVIRFQENPDGSTRVDIRLSYNPPAGAVGHAVAALFGADPRSQMDADLARVKTAIETKNPPRDAAQPIGDGSRQA